MQEEKKLALPRRIKGKHLSTFKDCKIETNYYKVQVTQTVQEIYIFKVVYTPFIPADNTKQRYSLLEKAMPEIKQTIPSPVISGANIYSLKPPTELQRDIKVDDYTIKIKQVKMIPVKENCKTLLMFLNNGLRNMFRKIGYIQIGKTGKFFQVKDGQKLDNDLKMFSGFKANFMWLEKGIFLRVDTAKKIVRNETVLDYVNSIYNSNKQKQRDEKRQILKNELIGKIIMTNYGKTRYLKITDVLFQSVDDLKLNGTDTTLRAFYQTKYHKKIDHPKQPLIQVEQKSKNAGDRTILVPELCLMTGIPDDFDEQKRKKISQATIRSPSDKKRQIQQFMKEASKVNDLSSLKELGIQIDNKLNHVTAKLIPNPRLELGNGKAVETGKEAGFNLFRDPVFDSKHAIKCGIFTIENADVKPIIDVFRNTSKGINVKFQCETFVCKERDRIKILNAYYRQIEISIKKSQINIALIVIPNFLKQNYGQIKRQCLKNLNIVSQCVVESTLRKKNLQSVATKLLLQMIAKRGNILWVPKMTGRLHETMIMAFDNAKGRGGNSIVCCATVNETFSSYYSKASKFNNNEDKFQEMVKLSFEGIDYYSKKNSKCPKQIIIFHNSCTGDQVSLFRNFFLQTLKTKLTESFSNGTIPNISLVMVNVKTNERFFLSDKNVQAGTIVADDIVSDNYDFYLVSQASNRGSSVPNHYKVVYTNSQIEEGLLHELIYSQCFNYVNWTGSIKIPGILQYAKKCAKFSAEALEGERVKEDLNNKLYFV